MKRLIQKGLMFGNLIHVASPAMVERYNRALEHLTGKRTALMDFYIDISGFSPEIGLELEDELYLNHAGVNRQFILLTTEQKKAPLLNAKFSTSRTILRHFIEENEPELFALTARDAVAGELVNSVYTITSPRKLFDIRKITIDADTTQGTVTHAHTLGAKVDRFLKEEEAWFDDVLIGEMIQLAEKTGDVTRNPVRLKHMEFEQGNFWTTHFGPLYVFQDVTHPAILTAGDPRILEGVPVPYVFHMSQRNEIAKFFDLNGLVEPIVAAQGVDAAAILRQKMDFILIDAVAGEATDLDLRSRAEMRRLARTYADRLPEEFHALAALVNWAENGGPWPRITSKHPAYFYTLRAADHPDADLINMALAELSPKDVRQLFICHKDLFYQTYAAWPDAKKAYVADYLEREYQVDKAGARAAIFGREPAMEGDTPPPKDLVTQVGPWGAIRRR
ncbi:hypothetical protein E4Z66_14080 [Aliishimia ponticola]|uniref:Uncharacterized protein n=1 Tax=Aliishimia ponticola TaxID=2499833 RepID=A0A4S4NA60_9RHOB|nr:DUF6638 family protein [Aliishimia ponticola]THH36176.1 hypothetical protein E4Z66_14080 [Aliishimia ponticola]